MGKEILSQQSEHITNLKICCKPSFVKTDKYAGNGGDRVLAHSAPCQYLPKLRSKEKFVCVHHKYLEDQADSKLLLE